MNPDETNKINFKTTSKEDIVRYVFTQFGEEIKRLILTYVKNLSQTDNIFQDFLITVYQKVDSFKEESSFKTWLYRIAINKSKDYLRSPTYRLQFSITKNPEDIYTKSLEQQVLLKELEKDVIEAVLLLPIKYREIFILRYYQSLTIREISESIGVNESTVKTRLSRGKKKLEKVLGGDYFEI